MLVESKDEPASSQLTIGEGLLPQDEQETEKVAPTGSSVPDTYPVTVGGSGLAEVEQQQSEYLLCIHEDDSMNIFRTRKCVSLKRNLTRVRYTGSRDCKLGLPDTRNPGYLGQKTRPGYFKYPIGFSGI